MDDKAPGIVLLLVAIVAQVGALWAWIQYLANDASFALCLLYQLGAALAAGCTAAWFARRFYTDRWHSVLLNASVISFFLPLFGQLMVGYALYMTAKSPAGRGAPMTRAIAAPRVLPELLNQVTYGSGLRMRGQLHNLNLSSDERLRAVVAIRGLPLHVSGDLLRELLTDPTEEIRLLAYGINDAAENRIRQEILDARQELDAAPNDHVHGQLAARLAELHWELVYQNLVHGELRQFTLRSVRDYAHEALLRDDQQAALWYLLGRCAVDAGESTEAREYFLRALSLGFPRVRLATWLAEADFRQGLYGAIPASLGKLEPATSAPAYQPALRYWSL